MPQKEMSPRRAAFALLQAVLLEDRLLSDLGDHPSLTVLDGPGRARARRLAVETLRQLGRADALLKPHLKKAPPPVVRVLLQQGTVELGLGGDAHGVVSELVGLADTGRRTRPFKGLVNAVLRKMAEEAPARWHTLAPPTLPKWIRRPLVAAWGQPVVQRIESVQSKAPPVDLTVKSDAAGWAERLGGTLLPTGSVRLEEPGQISAREGYETGDWWVQDAAAALPARWLDAQPGERVLDLCAAPGGKTMQLAATGAEVTALDLSEARMGRVAENLKRTRLTARLVTGDALGFDEGGWDAILLDAPCSATGTMRRHPDLPLARDGAEIGGLIALQSRMIDHALGLLAPGGRLMFCTCSLLPDEGEAQIDAALERHEGLTVDPGAAALEGVPAEWISSEGGIRTRPDLMARAGGIDGFYMALLRR